MNKFLKLAMVTAATAAMSTSAFAMENHNNMGKMDYNKHDMSDMKMKCMEYMGDKNYGTAHSKQYVKEMNMKCANYAGDQAEMKNHYNSSSDTYRRVDGMVNPNTRYFKEASGDLNSYQGAGHPFRNRDQQRMLRMLP